MSSTSQPPRKNNRRISSIDMQYLVVHCADTPDDKDFTAEDIHDWHKQRGWDGIGYHAVILRDGSIHPGRPDFWPGAHVKGHNYDSLGVCLVGRKDFTPEQLGSLREWLDEKAEMYPHSTVVGHRELDNTKPCPNFDVWKWWTDGAGASIEHYL